MNPYAKSIIADYKRGARYAPDVVLTAAIAALDDAIEGNGQTSTKPLWDWGQPPAPRRLRPESSWDWGFVAALTSLGFLITVGIYSIARLIADW